MGDYNKNVELEEIGYTKFYLTKKQHNSFFIHRQIWYDKYEYYFNEKEIILHRYYSLLAKLAQTILFPLFIIIEGYGNAKITLKRTWYQKEHHSYISDNLTCKHENFIIIMRMIKLNKLK